MHFVYILLSQKAQKSYVGITNDLERRMREHNEGKNSYTKRYIPWEIIYTEKLDSHVDAHKRELYLKSAAGRRFIKKQLFDK